MLRVGIDIGGTFTDFTVFDEEAGEIVLAQKVSSMPARPVEAIVEGLKYIESAIGAKSVSYVLHGTTVGLNTLLEEKGTTSALLTTKGFRDVYDIGRQWREHDIYNLFIQRPKMLLPRHNILEVDERLNYRGEVLRELDVAQARRVIQDLIKKGIPSIAVCLLFSYANPAHEQALKELIAELDPSIFVSLSSDINPEFREYERTSTTVANSYIGPRVSRYLAELQEKVSEVLPTATVLIMQSNGGVGTPTMLSRRPIYTLLSGPVSGVIGARYLCDSADIANIISIDVGGTSCDMSVIPGHLLTGPEIHIGRYPIRISAVDISTIGTGGGSIAKLGMGNVIKVGPASAGADPGPACYGLGGTEPTLTDALVVLGHLNPGSLLGGKMALDRRAAEQAIATRIAEPLGMSVAEAADGILRVLTAQVAGSMRTITVERGYDPREFTLAAFGGAGPTIAGELAAELSIPKVLVPPDPGNFCAFGMLTGDLVRERSMTRIRPIGSYEPQALMDILIDLEEQSLADLMAEKVGEITTVAEHFVELRYAGENYEVPVRLNGALQSSADIDALVQSFHDTHAKIYGHKAEGEPVETVNFRVRAIGQIAKPLIRSFPKLEEQPSAASLKSKRPAYFRQLGGFIDVNVYDRSKLGHGNVVIGPAVIEEMTSTTVVYPDQKVLIDQHHNMLLEAV